MNNVKLKIEVDNRVRAVSDEWKFIIPWIHKQEYREASYGLTRLICEAEKLKLTLNALMRQTSKDRQKE